ncbi:MAG: HD domain-containing protein [Butyribacter sp.]|nr:HD domain-containing protein [bacterium]MDY3854040.1 HD domain-containing protein [Butyribacter sp.]
MAGKRILTSRLQENMVTADDVYTAEEQLLIPSGTVLTAEIIEALREHAIFAIRIEVDKDGKTPVLGEPTREQQEELPEVKFVSSEPSYQAEKDSDEDNYFETLKNSKEYQEFHAVFLDTVDHLKDTFNRVVMQNEEIDSSTILSEVESVVSESRNSLHILDMLQCMKGYDDVTYVHSLNVALLSNVIGKIAMPKISKEDLDVLTLAGLLHDIGKMMIPDDVLLKKDRLTISEFNIIKTHVLHGNNILKNMDLDPRIAEVAMRHHERCDGSGYPGGYHGDQISPFAKIVAIADTYDAMTSDRIYRKAICPFDVIHMFEREGLVKYEVEYLLPFLSTAVQAYMNTEVRLTTDEIGKVVMVNMEELSKPIVKVGNIYYDLKKERSISIDRIID